MKEGTKYMLKRLNDFIAGAITAGLIFAYVHYQTKPWQINSECGDLNKDRIPDRIIQLNSGYKIPMYGDNIEDGKVTNYLSANWTKAHGWSHEYDLGNIIDYKAIEKNVNKR